MSCSKILRFALIFVFLVGFVSSCFFPEEFKAKININKDGTYSLVYDGILTFVPVKAAEVEQGKLTMEDERGMKELEQEISKEPNVEKVNYIGHGQFKVYYKSEGTLKTPIYFLSEDYNFFSITPTNDRKVEIRGMGLNKEDIAQLQALKMKVDGILEVTTDAKVIEHNSKSVSPFGSYKWQITSVIDSAPYMLIQLSETERYSSQDKMEERILSQARLEIENKLLHCEDSWYGWGGGADDFRGTLLELKNISIEVEHHELTKADRANGIEWKGFIHIKSALYREHIGKSWGRWKDGSGGVRIFQIGWNQMIEEPGVVSLVIENGKWYWSGYFNNAKKPNYNCEDIP